MKPPKAGGRCHPHLGENRTRCKSQSLGVITSISIEHNTQNASQSCDNNASFQQRSWGEGTQIDAGIGGCRDKDGVHLREGVWGLIVLAAGEIPASAAREQVCLRTGVSAPTSGCSRDALGCFVAASSAPSSPSQCNKPQPAAQATHKSTRMHTPAHESTLLKLCTS